MIQNKGSKRIILVNLLFLFLIGQIIAISALTNSEIEFSEEKKLIFGHARILFGYNGSLNIKEADINFIFWAILEDRGEDDVVWEAVRVDYEIKDLDEYEEDDSSVSLEIEVKSERTMTIDTAYENLTEEDLHFKIKFSFHEGDLDKDHTFKKNWDFFIDLDVNAFFIIPTICVLSLVSVLRRKSRNS